MEKIIISMNQIVIHKKTFLIPSAWAELQATQLLKISQMLLGDNMAMPIRKAIVLFSFIPQLKKYWHRHSWVQSLIRKFPSVEKKYPLLNEAQKWELLQCVDYLFTDISGKAILKSFQHGDVTYYLPGDNFKRESIIAFAFADEYFNLFVETGEAKYIDLLTACIARQKGSQLYPPLQFGEGDHREHFSTSRTEQRAQAFKTLPENIKTSVLIFFMGSKKYIHTHYEIMFRRKDADDDKAEETTGAKQRMRAFGKKKIPKPNFNWIGVIYELSETGVFGNFDQVKHMFVHTCCYYLSKKRYEREEQTT
jgi:hypothetical protein